MPLINLNQKQSQMTDPQANANAQSNTVLNSQSIQESKTNTLGDNMPLQNQLNIQTNNDGSKEFSQNLVQPPTVNLDPSENLDQKMADLSASMPQANQNPANNAAPTDNILAESKIPKNNILAPPSEINASSMSFEEVMKRAVLENASDIHITVGYRPIIRVDGELKTLNSKELSSDETHQIAEQILKDRKDLDVSKLKEIDLSYANLNRRFRVNIFRTMGDISIVMRIIPDKVPSIDELELPQILKELSKIPSGLVLLTGPTGSGKSTTLAAVLNYINVTRSEHIITLEDPIEFVFPKGQSLIDQREMGQDFSEWPQALRAMLRQDPNVVLVGEMRDYETIASTVTVSETGHLVFATLHTNSASQTIDRIIDVFPETQQEQIRSQLAQVLTAVVGQRLVPLPGGGRKAVHEIMIATPAVKNAIREGQTHQIDNMIQTGQDYGMSTIESDLVKLIRQGLISVQTAKEISIRPDELDILLNHI